jgi:hypothetical protein
MEAKRVLLEIGLAAGVGLAGGGVVGVGINEFVVEPAEARVEYCGNWADHWRIEEELHRSRAETTRSMASGLNVLVERSREEKEKAIERGSASMAVKYAELECSNRQEVIEMLETAHSRDEEAELSRLEADGYESCLLEARQRASEWGGFARNAIPVGIVGGVIAGGYFAWRSTGGERELRRRI